MGILATHSPVRIFAFDKILALSCEALAVVSGGDSIMNQSEMLRYTRNENV